MYKFEKLEVWELSLEYSDRIYDLAKNLPKIEYFNLRDQIIRAATSISLNVCRRINRADKCRAKSLPGHGIAFLGRNDCLHKIDSKTKIF